MPRSSACVNSGYGRKLDMRVVLLADGDYTPFWVESWTYQRWSDDPDPAPQAESAP